MHGPDIIFLRLLGRKLYLFRTIFRHYRADLHILTIYRPDGGEQNIGIDILLRHTFTVQIKIELLIIVFPIREIRIDDDFLDPSVGQQLGFQLFSPLVQFIIIVSVHLHLKRTGSLTNIITDPLILQAVYTPATSTQLQGLTDNVGFQCIGETAILMLFGKIDIDITPTGIVYRGLELLNFFKLAQIDFHLLDQFVHLLQRTAVRKIGIYIQHDFFVPGKIAAVVYLLDKQAQTTSQCFVDYRLDLLFVSGRSQGFVVPLRGTSFTLHFIRKHKHRKSEQ